VADTTLRSVIDEAVVRARHGFSMVFLPVAVPLALFQVAFILAQTHLGRVLQESPELGLLMIPAFVVFAAVYALASSVLMIITTDLVGDRDVSPGRAWLRLLRPRRFLTWIASLVLMGIGLLFCILPGVYLGLVLTFVIPVMIAEDSTGFAALRRSVELSGFNPGRRFGEDPRVRVFVLGFVGWLLAYVLGMLVQLPMMAVMMASALRDVAQGSPAPTQHDFMAGFLWVQIPTGILSTIVNVAVNLFIAFGVCLVFFDVRRRQSGDDLEAEIEALSGLSRAELT